MAYDIFYPATLFVAVYRIASYQCSSRVWYPKDSTSSPKVVIEGRTCSVADLQLETLMAEHVRKRSLLEQVRVCRSLTLLFLEFNCQQNSNTTGMRMRRAMKFPISAPSRIFHFNLRNVLSWYHNQTQESAGHVQFHGRPRVSRCFRCGFNSTCCGGTVFVGLREDNITLLSKVSCLFRTQKALKDFTYIVGAFEVSDEHSSVIRMNA